jgi:DNA-binding transcriptional ArsR family regulator
MNGGTLATRREWGGLAVLALPTLLVASSTSPAMLIAARAVLGVAGATLSPRTPTLISTMSDQKLKSLLDFAVPLAKVKCMLKHEVEAADRVFHALADANRRVVIARLTRGPATVSELAAQLGVTVAATVQHLRVLQDSELVRSEKVGRVRTCQIDPAGLRNAEAWLQRQRTAWEHRLDRLGAVLDDQAKESRS